MKRSIYRIDLSTCWVTCLAVLTLLGLGLQTPLYSSDNIRELPAQNAPNSYPMSVNGFHVIDFKVENLVAPQGIDVRLPRFSWKCFSQTIGEEQSAYQLIVTKSDGNNVVWDSGKVQSREQLYIQYQGAPLEPATEYFVELNVWNKDGSQKSQIVAPFSTGLFPTEADPQPWKGKWIGFNSQKVSPEPSDITKAYWIAYEQNFQLPVGPSVYRKTFEIENLDSVQWAVANFAIDNNGDIFCNGLKVGGADNYQRASTIDIGPFLKKGKNVIAIRAYNIGESPNPGGIIGSVCITDNDNNKTLYPTDDSWVAAQGDGDGGFLGYEYDDSGWAPAAQLARCGDAPWNEIVTVPVILPSPARYLSRVYEMKKDSPVKRAVVYFSGLGYSECYLNGVKLGDQVCGPMYTDYNKSVPYNTYDVTDIFHATQQIDVSDVEIGVVLGNGRYFALRSSCVHYGDPCLLFQMEVEYADGSKELVVSDELWKGTDAGPISQNNDYDGEVCDSREAKVISPDSPDATLTEQTPPRYLETRFGKSFVVSTPNNVEVVDGPSGKLVAQMIPPMRETMEIKPVSITEREPGRYIIDFGQNFVGVPRIKVKGKSGDRVEIRFAETLKDNGELYLDNLRTAQARDIYILSGDPEGEVYEPRFTQHGGRYAELIGFPGVPTLDSVVGYTVTTDLPLIGRFSTSNELINKIYRNIVWGTRGNYLSMPTDCPQRDERMGWQGDRAAESKGEMFIFDNTTLYNKWMQDIEESQRDDGNVSDVAPAYWPLYSPNVTWPTAQILIPQSLYEMRGDDSAIVKHYESRKKWLNFLLSLCNDDGTISKDNYGDWCVPPEKPELIHSQDPMRQTDRTLLATVYMINNLRISATFADYLGKTEDAERFRVQADRMQDVFNKRFYKPEEGIYDNGSQTSSVLPLSFNLVPAGEREKVFNSLVQNIETKTNRHLGTGLIGGQWINRLLSDMGRIDLPFSFVTNKDFPSWGYMVEKGATTIWELWNGDTADPAMNSGNHVMLVGDLVIWFYEYLAGIRPEESNPGFGHFSLCPNVVGDLTSVSASYDSARGMIKSAWNLKDGKFSWNITIPANTSASISVPTSDPESLKIQTTRLDIVPPEPGEIRPVKYTKNVADFDVSSLEKKTVNGRVLFELGCGSYQITTDLK